MTPDIKPLKTTKQVKKLIADQMNDRTKGISVSIWQSENEDDIDRIVIKFPRQLSDYIMLTHLTDTVLKPNKFHVAQIMGFMDDKLWILLVRDRR